MSSTLKSTGRTIETQNSEFELLIVKVAKMMNPEKEIQTHSKEDFNDLVVEVVEDSRKFA